MFSGEFFFLVGEETYSMENAKIKINNNDNNIAYGNYYKI